MSGIGQSGSAEEIKARAAQWLERRDCENWSAEDQAGLDDWLAESMAHNVAFWRLDAVWDRTERLIALRASGRAAVAQISRRWFRRALIATGAIGLTVAIGAVAKIYLPHSDAKIYATAVGSRETVALDDGSRIELNTDTKLRADINAHGRLVLLDRGEAYFEIRHDAAHPFVVMAGNHRIVDLGTKFLVRRDTDRLRVALVEGRAQFDATDNKAKPVSVELTPGDVVIAKENSVIVTRKSGPALAKELGWRRGVVVFDNTSLADAAVEFNRYSRKKIVLGDEAAAHLKIDGTFETGNIEAFADAAQDALGLYVDNRPGEIVISR